MKKIFVGAIVICITICGFVFLGKKEIGVRKVNIAEELVTSKIEEVEVYFPRVPDMEFVGESFVIDNSLSDEEKIRKIMKRLIEGPEDERLLAVVPEGTQINEVRVKKNIVYLDFSKEFIENHPGGSIGEYNTLYSIVNSLTEIDGIDAVDFSVEGEKLETYKGHCELSEPLYRDL